MSNLVQPHYPFPQTISSLHTHASFLAIWGQSGSIAKVIMIVRADGSYGFPGGKMEAVDGNNILNNIARETREEIGAICHYPGDIPGHFNAEDVQYLGACLCKDTFFTHFAAVETSIETMRSVVADANSADDFHSECAGIVIFDWTPFLVRKLLDHSSLALSVREEIYQLCAHLAIKGLYN
jgi:8-oxo-dGTP pyrophosphatase MutT (NUDIX family)